MICFSRFVVRYRWVFVAVFLVLTVAGCVAIKYTKVLYDLSDFLPKDSGAGIAMKVLKEEFDDKGMTYIAIDGVADEEEVASLAERISDVDGVANVAYDLTTNYLPEKEKILFTVSFDSYDSTERAFDTMERLEEELSDCTATFVGQSASSYYTKLETEESILTVGVAIVAVILIMLFVTARTYFEPVPMLIAFGVSVALNMGTNYFFFGISYISNLVSLVLQLALSVDYSVILMHRYSEERSLGNNAAESAVQALTKGAPEIFSGSLTTVAGLCSLMFMSLPIGAEIGIALTKGILCSMIAVLFLLPGLLVLFDKPLQKTRHKSFLPVIVTPAKYIYKARKVIVPVFLAVIIAAGVLQSFNTYSFNMNGGSKIVTAKEKVAPDFGTMNSLVIVVPKGDYEQERALAEYVSSHEIIDGATALSTIEIAPGIRLTDSFTETELEGAIGSLIAGTEIPEQLIKGMIHTVFGGYCEANGIEENENTELPLIDMILYLTEDETFSGLLGEDYRAQLGQLAYARQNLESERYARLTFNIDSDVESDETFALIAELKTGISEYYDEYYITGESVVCYDMAQYFPRDNLFVNLFTLAFIFIILFATFRNLGLPFVLVAAIQGGIWINFLIPYIAQRSTSFIGYLIISAVQMGATIDYAIVLTHRYRTTRRLFGDRYECMAQAQNAVFPTVITSGVILTVTGFALRIAASGVVAQMGGLLGVGALCSVLIVLFVLPSLLLVTEKWTDKCDFKRLFRKKGVKNVR